MIKKVYEVWCEWDIGQEYVVFGSTASAWKWAEEAIENGGFEESIGELADEGLIGVTDKEYIE